MSIRAPYLNRFQYVTGNTYGTRPANAYGTSITPGNNTFPAYAQILAGASVAQDCYDVVININSGAGSAIARDALVTIGIDPAGGTSYVDWIPNLLASQSSPYASPGGGLFYRFPLFVPAGASIAAKASVNNATVGTLRVAIALFGLPTAPELIRWGTYVDAFGATTASSSGTAITPGTASEGAWTSLGTETREHWWWQCGYGVNDSTASLLAYHADLSFGDGSNKLIIFEDELVTSNTSEQTCKNPGLALPNNCYAKSPGNATVYGRLWCSTTADASTSMMGYGVGG